MGLVLAGRSWWKQSLDFFKDARFSRKRLYRNLVYGPRFDEGLVLAGRPFLIPLLWPTFLLRDVTHGSFLVEAVSRFFHRCSFFFHGSDFIEALFTGLVLIRGLHSRIVRS